MHDKATFADLPEFGVAHFTNAEAMTGCTAFVCLEPDGATCGVDVRGGAPATRETDLLRPENMVQKANAVMIGGGSAFGLEASCGAMEELAERGFGFKLGSACVPIVPAACLFDLLLGESAWPTKEDGALAARDACESSGHDPAMGSVGAGCGATVGKTGLPEQAMKGGFGWSGCRMGDLVIISSVAVNALGSICDASGEWIAGPRDESGRILDPFVAAALALGSQGSQQGANTTLGVVLTNAQLDKAGATKVSQMAQDAFARRIVPSHTPNDGDAIFTMASCKVPARVDVVGMLACKTMEEAIIAAIRAA